MLGNWGCGFCVGGGSGKLKMGEGNVFEGLGAKESRHQLREEIGVMEDGIRPGQNQPSTGTGGSGEEVEQEVVDGGDRG